LSGKCLSGKRLSGKVIVRETSVTLRTGYTGYQYAGASSLN